MLFAAADGARLTLDWARASSPAARPGATYGVGLPVGVGEGLGDGLTLGLAVGLGITTEIPLAPVNRVRLPAESVPPGDN